MKLIIFSNVSYRTMSKYFIVTLGKDNKQTNDTVKQWINHKNMIYWDINIALMQVW
jgi:hypothetical protein